MGVGPAVLAVGPYLWPMSHPIFQIILMELRSYVREPGVIFWSIVFPIGISGVLGLGFLNRGEPVHTVAVELGRLPAGFRALEAGPGAQSSLLFTQLPPSEAMRRLQRGEVALVLATDSLGRPLYRYDPANDEARQTHLLLENALLKTALPTLTGLEPANTLGTVQAVTTQGYRYIDFLVPGLVAFGLMNSAVWGIGWGLVEYRMKKLLRRMAATPMRKWQFMLAQMLVRLLVSAVESALLIGFARLAFGVRLQGSWLAFGVVAVAGLWVFSGIGMLMGSRTQKTTVANGLVNAITLPMTILSGIFYSYQGFPDWAIAFIKLLPLTILSDTIRAVFNEGASLADVWGPTATLLGLGTALFVAGLRVFRWY
jgi:ABC-2 type transport system permease protein